MKKLLLLTLSAGLLLTGCYKKEVEENNRLIAELQEDLRQTSLNNALIITELQADLEGTIASNLAAANAALANAVAALEAADAASAAAINLVIDDIEADIEAIQARQAAYTAAAGQTSSNLSALARAVGTLQTDVTALDARVDVLEGINVTYGNWTPLFATQIASFTQTGDTFLGATIIGNDNVTRSVTVTSTINLVEQESTEQALFLTGVTSATADVNNDGTHHGQIFRYRSDRVYSGTVSGTGVIGTHTVSGTWSEWITNRILTN